MNNPKYINSIFKTKASSLLSNIHDLASHINGSSVDKSVLSRSIWLVFVQEGVSLEGSFSEVNVPFDCELLVAQPSRDNVRLVELYRVARHSPLEIHDFGSWSRRGGFVGPDSRYVFRRRNNLRGAVLNATYKPKTYGAEQSYDKNTLLLGGIYGPVWTLLERNMNFNTKHILPANNKSGILRTNGAWSGLIGLILRNEADVTSTGLTITSDRAPYITSGTTIVTLYSRVFIRDPVAETSLSALVSTFTPQLWFALILTALLTSIVMKYFYSFNLVSDERQRSFQESFFLFFQTIFCKQGDSECTRSIAKRIVLFSANIVGIIVISVYSGFLMSSLAVDRATLPFNTLDGFYKDGTYSIGMRKHSVSYSSFSGAVKPPLNVIYSKFIQPHKSDLPTTNKEAFRRVCTSKYCFIATDQTLASTPVKCEIEALPGYFEKKKMGLAFPKHSPYLRLFNYNTLKMLNSGILRKTIVDDTRSKTKSRPNEKRNEPETIDFQTIIPLLKVWLFGMLLSLIVLALEILVIRRPKPVKKVGMNAVVYRNRTLAGGRFHYKH